MERPTNSKRTPTPTRWNAHSLRCFRLKVLPSCGRSRPQSKLFPLMLRFAIEAHELTRRFGTFTAVDKASFSIRQGDLRLSASNGCRQKHDDEDAHGLLPPGREVQVAKDILSKGWGVTPQCLLVHAISPTWNKHPMVRFLLNHV